MEIAFPGLSKKIFCQLGLYCHYNLERNTVATVLDAAGIKPEDVDRFEFRGGEWPGRFTITLRNGKKITPFRMDIKDIFNIIHNLFTPQRCRMCIDGLNDFADLGLGDFYARDFQDNLSGLKRATLISQRTPKGRILLENAVAAGILVTHPLPPERMDKRNFRMAVQKRTKALCLIEKNKKAGIAVPNYHLSDSYICSGKTDWPERICNWVQKYHFHKAYLRFFTSGTGHLLVSLNEKRKVLSGKYKT
jgi:coenzyme F420 hydrogenase subunit beta